MAQLRLSKRSVERELKKMLGINDGSVNYSLAWRFPYLELMAEGTEESLNSSMSRAGAVKFPEEAATAGVTPTRIVSESRC